MVPTPSGAVNTGPRCASNNVFPSVKRRKIDTVNQHLSQYIKNFSPLTMRYRFTTYQDARRVRLVDGPSTTVLKQIFYEYHPLNNAQLLKTHDLLINGGRDDVV